MFRGEIHASGRGKDGGRRGSRGREKEVEKEKEDREVSPAVHRYRTVLAELLFRFVDLADEIDQAFARLRHALIRPFGEVKLPDRPRLPVLQGE